MTQTQERNQKIYNLLKKHPSLSHADLAERFGLSKNQIAQIITEVRKGEKENV